MPLEPENARFTLAVTLEAVRRIEAQTTANTETLGRILMVTIEMQRAAARTYELANAVRNRVAELGGKIPPGWKGAQGATSDEVLGMLSPIASALQDTLDLLSSLQAKEKPGEH